MDLGSLEILGGVGESATTCLVQIRPKKADGVRVDRVVTARLSSTGDFEPLNVSHHDATLITKGPRDLIFIASVFGHLTVLDGGHAVDLTPLASSTEYGVIRQIRTVGRELFAVGMAHQVHKYDIDRSTWRVVYVDNAEARAQPRVVGFNAIDGPESEQWVVVGFSGEIAEYFEGYLRFVTSPTNLAIFDICYRGDCGWIACGQQGEVLIKEKPSDVWREIIYQGMEQDLICVRPFNKSVFLLSRRSVLVLDRFDLPPKLVDVQCPSQEFLTFDVVEGALWLFSARSAFVSLDGVSWHLAASVSA